MLHEIDDDLRSGKSVVFDHINHTKHDREKLRKLAQAAGANTKIIFVDVPLEETLERRAQNLENPSRHHVQSPNLEKALAAWEAPGSDEQFVRYTPNQDIESLLRN